MVETNNSPEERTPRARMNIAIAPLEGCSQFVRLDDGSESPSSALQHFDQELSRFCQALAENPPRLQELAADLSALAERHRRLTDAVACLEGHAMIDPLTGLPNKRHFLEIFHMDVSHALRQERHGQPQQLHTLFIDLDHFKEINDDPRFGHDVGDQYLKTIGEHLQQALHRDYDLVARIGGDEFAALLLDCDKTAAFAIAERIRAAVRLGSKEAKKVCEQQLEIVFRPDEANVTASVGMAALDGEGDSADALLKRADKAMYEAKRTGKDRVIIAPNIN